MLRYETLFLAVPEITADESNTIESQIDSTITGAKGTVISYERWGKYQLSYPVRKYEYGIYFLVRFEVSNENKNSLLEAIRTLFTVKQPTLVMRHTIAKLDPQGSLEYKRAESLEEVPTRDVDVFLKENKMTGLLGKSSASSMEAGLENDNHDEDELEEE